MAHIKTYKDRFRAEVYKHGVRASKVHVTEDEAKAWAQLTEEGIVSRVAARKKCAGATYLDILLISSIPTQVLDAIRSVPFSRETILDAAIPCSELSGIYFLMKRGEVMYVGQSIDVLKRISRHMRDGRKFESYAFISCPRDKLDNLEENYIKALVPRWNLSLGPRRGFRDDDVKTL